MNDKFTRWLEPIPRRAWLLAATAGGFCVIGIFFSRAHLFQGWFFAWLFWFGISLGALVILLVQFLTGGAWGFAIRRLCEAAITAIPLLAALFLPVLFATHDLFPWTHPTATQARVWVHKQIYLSIPFFTARALLYFAVFIALAIALRRWSARHELGTTTATHPLRKLSSGGILAYLICMNFASTDWILSLEPEWYSTMLAIVFMTSQLLSAMALMTAVLAWLAHREPLASRLTAKHFHEIGNLLLALVIFWAYVAFSQFLVIWSGNLPKEIGWYLHRRSGGWQWVALILAAFQFLIPFALLLSRAGKRHKECLGVIAMLIFAASIVNVFWLVAPAFHPGALRVRWLDLATFIAIGGAWFATFCSSLNKRSLLPPGEET